MPLSYDFPFGFRPGSFAFWGGMIRIFNSVHESLNSVHGKIILNSKFQQDHPGPNEPKIRDFGLFVRCEILSRHKKSSGARAPIWTWDSFYTKHMNKLEVFHVQLIRCPFPYAGVLDLGLLKCRSENREKRAK